MDTINMVLCGLGGQGILFMTKVLAHSALHKGLKVMGAETHGMAQRGGSVVSHLRFGEVESSLVRSDSAHYLMALDETEGYRNLPFLGRGATMLVNSGSSVFPREEVRAFLTKREVICRRIDATAAARALGAPLFSNLALLGYFSAFGEGPISHEEMRTTIQKISPDRFKESNIRIFDAGFEKAGTDRHP